ncbi:MAG: DUF6519 domain-containing protein [Terracidiphilus sp.]
MSFDTSRFTFNPWKNYSGVVMEQGRVQLDSDWNEWLAELRRHIQAQTLDVFGFGNPLHNAVYPATTPFAFQITVTSVGDGPQVNIGPGRMYVDGLLVENHGQKGYAQWDPALAELSGSPQPPATTPTETVNYLEQPYYPQSALPSGNGPFLAYLDVWERAVTYLEDPHLVDPAVNVDTTGRIQTVWQVKLWTPPTGSSVTCASTPWSTAEPGQLTNGYFDTGTSGPCCLTSGSGYTGMENQFYRVEIHQPGVAATGNAYPAATGTATFKWSRDNASVETGVTAIQTVNSAAQLTVLSLGRDQVLGFAPGNWIELIDDNLELLGQFGELHLIASVDPSGKTIQLVDKLQTAANFPVGVSDPSKPYGTTPSRHTRIRRWDQSGQIYQADSTTGATTLWVDLGANTATGDIPVPPAGTTLIMESGITITFGPNASTQFNSGDFWNFAARASTGKIDRLDKAPTRGIHHHYAPLSVVTFAPARYPDCRTEWPPSSESSCGCCNTYTVGANGDYATIQAAIQALPASGGEIQILPGRYYENVFIEQMQDVVIRGCGEQTRVASEALAPGYTAPTPSQGNSTTINAVFSIATSQHIELRDFAVEAAPDEAGILIDGTGYLIASPPGSSVPGVPGEISSGGTSIGTAWFMTVDMDIAVENLVLTAAALPAIFSVSANLVRIRECTILMANEQSTYAGVWMSGDQNEFVRNRVGLQTTTNLNDWLPESVYNDLVSDANNTGATLASAGTLHPGGIQIAGPSAGVLVAENEIVGGSRQGITLGGYSVLNANLGNTNYIVGVMVNAGDNFLSLASPYTFNTLPGSSVVVSGGLTDITIDRNTITDFGLCGIGPVGYYNLAKALEVVPIEGLTITANKVSCTATMATGEDSNDFLGYGAIALPSVEGLVIRDNVIDTFGQQPGLGVCGIYLLHGESVEISRNQVIDNRDWEDASQPDQTGNPSETAGAIEIVAVTPPSLAGDLTGTSSLSIFEPGLPALRVEENVVRVPLGAAFTVRGYGPFSISDNHFSCGGNIPGTSSSALKCVRIVNMGACIEFVSVFSFLELLNIASNPGIDFNNYPTFTSSSGAVLFTNNYCQLEIQEVPQTSFASVEIMTHDHLIFSNNHCWLDASVDAAGEGMTLDAYLMAYTLNVVGNRFQEAIYAVGLSAVTVGVVNVTTQNISTGCIWAKGALVASTNNLSVASLIDTDICARFVKG